MSQRSPSADSSSSGTSSTLSTPQVEQVPGDPLGVRFTAPLNVARTGVIVVELTIISALNLPLTRFRVRPPNPRLTVLSTGTPATYQTQTVHRSTSPSWNETIHLTLNDVASVIRFEVAHNSNIPTYEYVLGSASLEVKTLRKTTETLQLPLSMADVPGHELAGCGSIVISARRTAVRKIVSEGDERRSSVSSEGRSSPRTTTLLRTFSGRSAPDGDAIQAYIRILIQLERLDAATQENAELYPLVPLAWTILSTLLKNVRDRIIKNTKIAELLKEIAQVYHFVDDFQTTPRTYMTLQIVLRRILKQTVNCGLFLQEYAESGFTGSALRAQPDVSKRLRGYIEMFKSFHSDLRRGSALAHKGSVSVPQDDLQTLIRNTYISRLNPVEMDGAHRSTCQPRACLSVMEEICRWVVSPSEKTRIFWLHGDAGPERSNIATTIAQYFQHISRLGAFIFFDSESPARSNPTMLFRTIAAQISVHRPLVAEAVVEAVKETPTIGQSNLAQQFTELLVNPLQQDTLQCGGPLIIVIDALDECGTTFSREQVLSILAEQSNRLPSFVRIVITSRLAQDICDAFRGSRHILWRKVSDNDAWSEV